MKVMAILLAAWMLAFCLSVRITRAEQPGAAAGPTTYPALRELARVSDASGNFVAFSRDGSKFVTSYTPVVDRSISKVQVWDARTFEPIGDEIEHHGGLNRSVFDGAGKKLLTVGFLGDGDAANWKVASGEARVWDATTGKPLLPPINHGKLPVTDAAISPDGRLIATANMDDPTIRLWDVATGKQTMAVANAENVASVQFDMAGDTLVAGSHNAVTLWDVRTGKIRLELDDLPIEGLNRPVLSLNGKRLAVCGHFDVAIYDLSTGKQVAKISPELHLDEYIQRISLSADGTRLATQSLCVDNDSGVVWDVTTGKQLLHVPNGFPGVVLSPDGTRVIFEFFRKSVLYDVPSGRHVDLPQRLAFGAAEFSPDGTRLAVPSYHKETVLFSVEKAESSR